VSLFSTCHNVGQEEHVSACEHVHNSSLHRPNQASITHHLETNSPSPSVSTSKPDYDHTLDILYALPHTHRSSPLDDDSPE
jgi:hypothetical protein